MGAFLEGEGEGTGDCLSDEFTVVDGVYDVGGAFTISLARTDVHYREMEGGGFNDATAGVAYEDGSDVEETNVVEVREGRIDSEVREEGTIGLYGGDYFLTACIGIGIEHDYLGGRKVAEGFEGLDDVREGEAGRGGDGMLNDHEERNGVLETVLRIDYVRWSESRVDNEVEARGTNLVNAEGLLTHIFKAEGTTGGGGEVDVGKSSGGMTYGFINGGADVSTMEVGDWDVEVGADYGTSEGVTKVGEDEDNVWFKGDYGGGEGREEGVEGVEHGEVGV